jgi:hypothetical protein
MWERILYVRHQQLFFSVLGLELRVYTLSHSTSPIFCDGFFRDRVSWTISPGWLWITILLISASWVARITGVSHQHPPSTSLCHHSHAWPIANAPLLNEYWVFTNMRCIKAYKSGVGPYYWELWTFVGTWEPLTLEYYAVCSNLVLLLLTLDF